MRAPLTVLLVATALIGCSGVDDAVTMPFDAPRPSDLPLAPPLAPDLEIVEAIVRGQDALFRVTGVPEDTRVWVLASTRGPGVGPCHPVYSTLCLDVRGPVTPLGSAQADASGTVEIALYVPFATPTSPLWLQAAAIDLATGDVGTSAIVPAVVDDSDLDLFPDDIDNCPADFNPGQIDSDGDGWGVPCDCVDSDSSVYPGAFDPPGDGIDQDCSEAGRGAYDGSYSGAFDMTFNLGTGPVPCPGTISATIDSTRVPVIEGSATCLAFGIPFTFTLDGDHVGTTASGTISDGTGSQSWSGLLDDTTGVLSFSGTFSGGYPGIGTYTGLWNATAPLPPTP